MADVVAHHQLITKGDMNARLGKESDDDPYWYFHSCTNKNGELLRDTALECDTDIINIDFTKKTNKMWTHLSDGTLNKGQIDYILIRRKWRDSLKNTWAFQSLGSDHRVVVSKVKVSFRKSRKPSKRTHYVYGALKVDAELQNRCAMEIHNRFSCLVEVEGDAADS
jgi:L-rhamnose isomerase